MARDSDPHPQHVEHDEESGNERPANRSLTDGIWRKDVMGQLRLLVGVDRTSPSRHQRSRAE